MGKKEEIKETKDRSRLAIEVAFLIKAVKAVLNRHRRLLWRKDDIDLISKEIASVWLNMVKEKYGKPLTDLVFTEAESFLKYQCKCGKVQLLHKERKILHVCKKCGTEAVYKIK